MIGKRRFQVPRIAFALIAVGLFLTACNGGPGFSVVFDRADGLTEGDPVVYRGLLVGEVAKISFAEGGEGVVVAVRLDSEYSDLIRSSATFCIEEPQLIGFEGQRQLRIEVWDDSAPLIESNQQFTGARARASCWMQDAKSYVENQLRLGELHISTAVEKSGAASREITLDRGRWIPTEWALGNLLPDEGDGWQRREISRDQSFELHVSRQASSPDQLGWERSRVVFTRQESFFHVDYVYEEEFTAGGFEIRIATKEPQPGGDGDWFGSLCQLALSPELCSEIESDWFGTLCDFVTDPDSCDALKEAWNGFFQRVGGRIGLESLLPLDELPTRITLTLPGRMRETDAPLVAGGTASWNVTAADLNEGLIIRAESRQLRTGRIVGVSLGGAAVLVAAVIGLVAFTGGIGGGRSRPPRRSGGKGRRKRKRPW